MPINANIPLSGRPVQIKQPNYMQQMAQAAAMKNQQTQNQLAQMGLEKAQGMEAAKKASFNPDGTFNMDVYMKKLAVVAPLEVAKFKSAQKKQDAQLKEMIATTDSAKLKAIQTRGEIFSDAALGIMNTYQKNLKDNGGNVQAAIKATQLPFQFSIENLRKRGMDVSNMPKMFNPAEVDQFIIQHGKLADQIALAKAKHGMKMEEIKRQKEGDTRLKTTLGNWKVSRVISAWKGRGKGTNITIASASAVINGEKPKTPDEVGFYDWWQKDKLNPNRKVKSEVKPDDSDPLGIR